METVAQTAILLAILAFITYCYRGNLFKYNNSFYSTSNHFKQSYKLPSLEFREKEVRDNLIRRKGSDNNVIFHGGCLSCKAPEHFTPSVCYRCTIYNWVGKSENKLDKDLQIEIDQINYPAKYKLTDIVKPDRLNTLKGLLNAN